MRQPLSIMLAMSLSCSVASAAQPSEANEIQTAVDRAIQLQFGLESLAADYLNRNNTTLDVALVSISVTPSNAMTLRDQDTSGKSIDFIKVARSIEDQSAQDQAPSSKDLLVRTELTRLYADQRLSSLSRLVIVYRNDKDWTARQLVFAPDKAGELKTVLLDDGLVRLLMSAKAPEFKIVTLKPSLQTNLRSMIARNQHSYGTSNLNEFSLPSDKNTGMNSNLWTLRMLGSAMTDGVSQSAELGDINVLRLGYRAQTLLLSGRERLRLLPALKFFLSPQARIEPAQSSLSAYGIVQAVTDESIVNFLSNNNLIDHIRRGEFTK